MEAIRIDDNQYPIKPVTFQAVKSWNVLKNQLTNGMYDQMSESNDTSTRLALDVIDCEIYLTVFLPELDVKKLFNNFSGRFGDLDFVDNYPKISDILKQFRAILNPKIEKIVNFLKSQDQSSAGKEQEKEQEAE